MNELGKDSDIQAVNPTATLRKLLNTLDIYSVEDLLMFFPYKYRNNIHLAVEQQAHRTLVGFYSQGGKNLIDINNCLLFNKEP